MYSEGQLESIAYELARAGGNVRACVASLRSEYESFRTISASTLKRAREQKGFVKLFGQYSERIKLAREEARAEQLAQQARASIETSRQRDLRVLETIQERAPKIVKDLKPPQLAKYHVDLLSRIEKARTAGQASGQMGTRKRKAAPASEDASIENV